MRALALVLTCENATRLKFGAAELARVRAALRGIAENRSAPAYARDMACRVLLTSEWDGREAWYDRLLADVTLQNPTEGGSMYSPLSWVFETGKIRYGWVGPLPPNERSVDPWVARLLPRLAEQGAVRDNVAQVLAQLCDADPASKRPVRKDVALALLPWLDDPRWAKDSPTPRADYISSLGRIDLPQAVPGLIHVVETERGYVTARAAEALARYRDARAVAALRKGLNEHLSGGWERDSFLEALLACGGFSAKDKLQALERFGRLAAVPGGAERVMMSRMDFNHKLDVPTALGLYLAQHDGADPALVEALAARVAALRTGEPEVASALEAPLFVWSDVASLRYVVSRLAAGGLDERRWKKVMFERNLVAAACGTELAALIARGRTLAGQAAALTGRDAAIEATLKGSDASAIVALLDASLASDDRRYDDFYGLSSGSGSGAPILLPVDTVGALLGYSNADVAASARRWLAHEGGARAAAWLQAKPGTAPSAAPTVTHRYNIGGVRLGMTRAEVEAAWGRKPQKRNVELPYKTPRGPITMDVRARDVEYSSEGRVVAVTGTALRDGDQTVVAPGASAAEVRTLFGRPQRITFGHVVLTIGGFFWHYSIGGGDVVFSFTDDSFSRGEKAPLYQVVLIDLDGYEKLYRRD